MLSDSRGDSIICILFLDFARFAITLVREHDISQGLDREPPSLALLQLRWLILPWVIFHFTVVS